MECVGAELRIKGFQMEGCLQKRQQLAKTVKIGR